MKPRVALLVLAFIGAQWMAACAPKANVQVSIPAGGVVIQQPGATLAPPPAQTPAPAQPSAAAPTGPSNGGLDNNSALFLYAILGLVGIIVIGLAFGLFTQKPDK